MTFYARKSDSFCAETASPDSLARDSGTPGGSQRITLIASVGNRGENQDDDTRKIQRALNEVPPDKGRATPLLTVDGKCGPKTIKAIQNYQLKHFGWSGADGLVEPQKRTVAKLNEDSGAIPSFPDMAPTVRLTQAWVAKCLFHLGFVSDVLDKEDPPPGGPFQIRIHKRAERMRLVNKHFDLDVFPNKREMFHIINRTFDRMHDIFLHPGGLWGVKIFDKDPANRAVQAYVAGGGYILPPRDAFVEGHKIRSNTVYLCARFANELQDVRKRAFVVIHELAHFVGHPQPIKDHAHNKQGGRIRTMPSNLKIINAETYANFAWEVANNEDAPIF
jgi:hypothetical protein